MSAANAQKKRRGCGCLTGCGIVLLVGLIGCGLLLIVGKNWLIDQAQERLPGLAMVKGANLSLDGDREGSTEPKDFPAQVPLPEGASAAAFRTSDAQAIAVLRFDERSVESITGEVRGAMRAVGWRVQRSHRLTGGVRLRFGKKAQRCEMEIVAAGRGSEIWVRWRPGDAT